MKKYMRLGDLLVGSGLITQQQLDEGLKAQGRRGKRLGTVLQELGFLTEKQLINTLMQQLGVEYIDLNSTAIPSEMAQILPKSIAKKYCVVPVRASRTDIHLAMPDPLNFVAIEEVRTATRRRVIPMICTTAAAERAVQNLYSNQGALSAIEEMQQDLSGDQYGAADTGASGPLAVDEEESSTAPAIRLVNAIVDRAFTERASDIHLEPGEDAMNVRMRIDGALHSVLTVPKELQNAVISRLKIMAKMDIAQRALPQDGRAEVTVQQEGLDLRISTLPTIFGEKVVIRLLRKTPELSTMKGVGLRGRNLERVQGMLNNTAGGIILMVGPTGSGKTSTLYTMIDYLRDEAVNLISLEDPVEYHMDKVCQVQINEKIGLTFASALRAVLRQDPDVVALGEIRDGETAEIAMRAAMTGHLVLSTVHTNSAASAIVRLLDIGVEPYLIAGAVRGIVSQRLVRKICPHCKKEYEPVSEELELLGFKPGEVKSLYTGEGCEECFHTGFRGRTGAFEVLQITPAIRRAIHSNSMKALEQAISEADFQPILEDCRALAAAGVTSAEEIHRALGDL